MTINTETLMQFVTYLLIVVGVVSFLVSVITQAIKEMPKLKNVQTNVLALAISLILCPLAVIVACQYFNIVITWYYIFASFIAAFIVYLVSTGGWEKVAKMWNRSKYKKTK